MSSSRGGARGLWISHPALPTYPKRLMQPFCMKRLARSVPVSARFSSSLWLIPNINSQYCHNGAAWSIVTCLNARVCSTCSMLDFVSMKHLKSMWGKEADERLFRMLPWNAAGGLQVKREKENPLIPLLLAYGTGKIAPGKKAYHLPTCEVLLHNRTCLLPLLTDSTFPQRPSSIALCNLKWPTILARR